MSAATAPARIFIVEDEALIVMELEDRLQALGYQICGSAAVAELALERIHRMSPDLVLLDIQLTGEKNGIHVAQELARTRETAVVLLSAFSDQAYIKQAVQAGVFGYLVKPFAERELHSTIQTALGRYRAERDLRAANSALERRVQLALHEQDATQRDRTTARDAGTRVLQNMQHELRTPMQHVIGLVSVLSATPVFRDDPQARRWLDHLLNASRNLGDTVERVLDLKDLNARRTEFSLAPVDPFEIVREALALMLPVAQAAEISLESPAVIEPPLRVVVDRDRLRQVLLNLLSNAVTYNRPGGCVQVEVSREPDCVVLRVLDTGIGMTEYQLERAFDSCARFVPRGRVIGGIGIGLTVARQVVENMGGRIEAVSQPGEGSVFSVRLPA